MIPYRGRSLHKVKLKNKPISEGYKVWVLADNGYAWDWLWHSHQEGPKEILKGGLVMKQIVPNGPDEIRLTLTFALVIRLVQRLR
jgi:hypothetical protein